MKYIIHLIISILLTLLTQIGGLLYLSAVWLNRNKSENKIKQTALWFAVLYLTATFVIVPVAAPLFGREKVQENDKISAHTFITKLFNRNYVRPELNLVLQQTATDFTKMYPNMKLIYLDANFPFFNGFQLLPHLSHNDGKKIDLAFVYKDRTGKLTNQKPSLSGYGKYVQPLKTELNQTKFCKQKGYWQYDYSKYFTFGSIHPDLQLAKKPTQKLIEIISKQKGIKKIFIEPNLKNRLHLHSSKIRFHGCRAVRHDDHIHIQL